MDDFDDDAFLKLLDDEPVRAPAPHINPHTGQRPPNIIESRMHRIILDDDSFLRRMIDYCVFKGQQKAGSPPVIDYGSLHPHDGDPSLMHRIEEQFQHDARKLVETLSADEDNRNFAVDHLIASQHPELDQEVLDELKIVLANPSN